MQDFSLEEESLVNSDEDDISILVAVVTYMRRNLYRNKGFHENILPEYAIDEFKSHFRMMTRGPFEALCREVQATGRVPQQHAFGRPPIPLDKQVSAFVWFIANSVAVANA